MYHKSEIRKTMIIKREKYLNQLIASKHNGLIKIVTGVRRCGKSYLLFNLFKEHLLSNGVTESHIIQVDLEDRRNKALRDPDALLAYIDSKIKDSDMHYILLDEVQHVPEFEDVLNSYLKIENADVYVTGSNSKFLSSDIITEFRGRGTQIHVYPLSFAEFMTVPYFLRQLSAFFITYISGRCSYQTGYGEFFHVFTHVNADTCICRTEH